MPDRNRRVMMIDDDLGDTLLLKKLLLKHNKDLEIDVEQDPENALLKLEALAENTPDQLPDVILLDINISRFVWKQIVGDELTKEDIRFIDALFYQDLETI